MLERQVSRLIGLGRMAGTSVLVLHAKRVKAVCCSPSSSVNQHMCISTVAIPLFDCVLSLCIWIRNFAHLEINLSLSSTPSSLV